MKAFVFILGLFIFMSAPAQTLFHYDTIPNPNNNNNQRQLYKYERPQMQQDRSTTVKRPLKTEEKKSGFDKSKLLIGGSFGLTFGDYTSININPQVGYAFSQYFSAGIGVSYDYYKYKHYDQSLNYLGANLYGRLNPIKYIAIQAQPEIYNMWGTLQGESVSQSVPCFLVGAGVIIPSGGNGGISMMLYYDLVQNKYSPYGDNQVVYSIGYVFNF